jgi:sn-glycerol 3-phosphate transport system substrate-binding protein
MLRRAILTTAAVALLGPPAQAAVEITFWHSLGSGAGLKVIETLVERFHAAQSEVRVRAEFAGDYGDTVTKLQAAIPARRQPDLVMLEITRYGLFAERAALEPLEPWMAKAGPGFADSLRPFALEASLYQGRSYVLPFNVSTPLMYYNKGLLAAAGLDPARPPRTWDELDTAARMLTRRAGDTAEVWGLNVPPQWVRWAMANQNGGGWVDPATNAVLMDRPETIEAYAKAAGWAGRVGSRDAALDERIAKQLFITGTAAIHFDSTGSLGNLARDAKFALGVAPLPCRKVCAAPIGGAALGMLAGVPGERKEGAWAFLAFINRPEQNATMFAVTGYLPILRTTTEQPEAQAVLAKDPAWSVAIDQLDVAFTRARPPAMPAIRAKEEQVFQGIVLGKATAEEALTAFAAEMRELIARN